MQFPASIIFLASGGALLRPVVPAPRFYRASGNSLDPDQSGLAGQRAKVAASVSDNALYSRCLVGRETFELSRTGDQQEAKSPPSDESGLLSLEKIGPGNHRLPSHVSRTSSPRRLLTK